MAKNAVIKIGKNPAECSITIDGKFIQNVVEIKLAIDVEYGPFLQYTTTVGGVKEDIHAVDFDIIVEDEERTQNTLKNIDKMIRDTIKIKEGTDGKKYFK